MWGVEIWAAFVLEPRQKSLLLQWEKVSLFTSRPVVQRQRCDLKIPSEVPLQSVFQGSSIQQAMVGFVLVHFFFFFNSVSGTSLCDQNTSSTRISSVNLRSSFEEFSLIRCLWNVYSMPGHNARVLRGSNGNVSWKKKKKTPKQVFRHDCIEKHFFLPEKIRKCERREDLPAGSDGSNPSDGFASHSVSCLR